MRRYFRNRKLQKHVKHYVDPNAIRDDKDDATSYLKDIAGLATILGVGATGGALLPNGRVYAAQTSVDPKSQVVGSVSDFIKSGASDTTGSKSDSKTFSISASEDKTKSTSASKSTQLSQSLSKSLSQSISQSESLSHSLSESESALNSLSLAKSKEKEAKSNKQTTSTSHKSDSKASQSETANVKKSGQNNRRSAENSLSNNSTSANQEQSSTYASTSNDITTNLQASLNLSNDLSSLSNLPLAFNSVSSNNSTSNNSNSQLPVTLAANFMTLAASNDAVVKPDFTGTALLGYIGTDGKYVSGSDISYTSSTSASSFPNLAFRLSTANHDTTNSQQFFVMIPKGFKSSVNDFSQLESSRYTYPFNAGFYGPERFSSSEYSVKDLGEIGPKGEQVFSITLTSNPGWGNNFGGQFKLALDSTVTGQYTYDAYGAPIVSELATDAQGWNNGKFKGFTIDGKHVDVVNTEGYASSIQYAVNQALKPTFTGTATLGNLSNGTFVSANNTNYTADTPTTDLPTLNVRLSTNGTTTVDKPQFIVAIPKGFTATGNSLISSDTVSKYFGDNFKGTNSFSSSDYSVESIGTNSNGEELYLVKLNFNPLESDNKDLGLQFKLALDSSAQGSYTYNSSSTPLVSELASDGQSTAGTATITANGTTYDVVKSSNATNLSYYINDAHLPDFTGDAVFGNLNTSNKEFVSGNGINYTSTSTNLPTLSVRLSTSGTSTVNNPQFIVMIPKGFTSSTSGFDLIPANPGNYFNGTFNGSNTNKDYSIQDLGKIGPNGEQLFKVTLNFNPSWDPANNFGGQFKLSFDPTAPKKYYSYDPSGAPIVSELADDANPSATGDSNHYTFTAAGQNINVVKSSYYQGIQYGIDTTAIPEFTGTANFDANGKIFNVGDTIPEYTFRLSTWGNSTVQNPKFIVMIPAGFTATTNDFSPIKNATIESLGTDSNGQQLFEISLKGGTPNWGTDSISGSVRLTLTPTEQNGGSHTYSNLTAPLVSEVSDYAQPSNGTYTFHVGNKDINVVQSPQTVNWSDPGKHAANSAVSLTYTINTGTTALPRSEYSITNPSVTLHKGTTGQAGYEQLTFTITPKQNAAIQSGQYIDVKLGLPTNTGTVVPYDTLLADKNIPLKAPDGTQIATAYKMGTYYRIVFNSNAAKYTSGNNNLTLTPILRWGNPTSQNPSISVDQSSSNTDNLGAVYVYEGTETQSEDGTKFVYTPQHDININGQPFTSGLRIQGQKVYTEKYLDFNKDTEFNINGSFVRTWTSKNTYTNNGWFNTVTFKIATSDAQDSNGKLQPDNDTGTDFYLTVKVGDNSNFKYSWETGADVKNQIVGPDGKSGILAQYKQNVLGQTKVAGSNYSLAYTQDSSDRIKSGVTVDDPKITKTDGIITAVYHIKLANLDAKLLGELKLLTVSADGFTKPADIQSYQQDEDNTIKGKNYTGVATSNTVLQNALINTKAPQGSIQKKYYRKHKFSRATS